MNKKATLSKRLASLAATILVPFAILVIYLITCLMNFCNAYNQIVKSITVASAYNSTFREDVDYSVYRIVVNRRTYAMIEEERKTGASYKWETVKDPYEIIGGVRNGFERLMDITEEDENQERIEWILVSLERLEMNIGQIEENIIQEGNTAKNQELLENAVYILTEDIQEEIQEYVYHQAQNFDIIRGELERKQSQALIISLGALVLILLLTSKVSTSIIDSIANPIKELCKATEEVGKGDFTTTTRIESGDEIQVLTKSFNHMKGEIGQLIDDIKLEQDNLRATELKLLQAQINPHFLYNTLDAIIWLAEDKQNDQVVDMVTDLSSFFRVVLSEGKDFITIREEQMHIESYLSIQRFRYQDILEYEVDIDPELYHCQIVKLTLQPLVENALYHGIKNKRGKGIIKVKGYQDGDRILFEVSDNGMGMTPEELKYVRDLIDGRRTEGRRSFGIANVGERIRMNYGNEYGITYDSTLGEGTVVTVCIPISA